MCFTFHQTTKYRGCGHTINDPSFESCDDYVTYGECAGNRVIYSGSVSKRENCPNCIEQEKEEKEKEKKKGDEKHKGDKQALVYDPFVNRTECEFLIALLSHLWVLNYVSISAEEL